MIKKDYSKGKKIKTEEYYIRKNSANKIILRYIFGMFFKE